MTDQQKFPILTLMAGALALLGVAEMITEYRQTKTPHAINGSNSPVSAYNRIERFQPH